MIATTTLLLAIAVYLLTAYVRMRKTVHRLEYEITSKQDLIQQFQEAYTVCAKRSIQHRLTLMQIDSPHLRSSPRVFSAIEEIKQKFASNKIDAMTYYNEVNSTLDLVSTKNYN
jgi:hypothetical protein